MNAAELHLALNHVPILGTAFGILLLLYGRGRDSDPVVRAAFWALGLAGVAAVGTYFTGEPAEHLVEELARTSEAALERHEEVALWAAIGGGALGAVALLGLALHRRVPIPRRYSNGLAVLGVVVAGLLLYTAYQGGRIRHPELRPDFVPAAAEHEEEAEGPAGEREADDDEGSAAGGEAGADARTAIVLPPAGRRQVLAEMRTMLRAVDGVVSAAATGDREAMRESALSGGTRIAVDMAAGLMEQLPGEFVGLGMSTHRDFDALAAAIEAGAGRDSVFAMLGSLMDKCVSCHESYRLSTPEESE